MLDIMKVTSGIAFCINNLLNKTKRKRRGRFMKKKVLSLIMATAMVATLVGCGNNTAATTTEAPAEEAAVEAEVEAATEAAEAEAPATEGEEAITCELEVWGPSEDQSEENGNWLPTMCEQFAAQHPNWDITFKYGVCAH